jgi:hypothetical protein
MLFEVGLSKLMLKTFASQFSVASQRLLSRAVLTSFYAC